MAQKYFEGKDGFVWARGVVESRMDPLFLGRCKVRYFGWHTDNKEEIPTKDLPWSYPMVSLDPGRAHTVGPKEGDWIMAFFLDGEQAQFPVMMGIIPGIPEKEADPNKGFNDPRNAAELHRSPREPASVEFFDDGSGVNIVDQNDKSRYPDVHYLKEADTTRLERGWEDGNIQETLVWGKILSACEGGQVNVPCAGKDIPEADPRAEQLWQVPKPDHKDGSVDKGTFKKVIGSQTPTMPYFWDEPVTPYEPKYPYNHVYFSESGHCIEIDDTPKKERLHWYHRSGTFREIHPLGLQVEKIVGDEYHITLKSRYTHIEASDCETVDHAKKLLVNADNKSGCHYDIMVGQGSNINIQTNFGECNLYINGDINLHATGSVNVQCGGNLDAAVTGNANLTVAGNLGAVVEKDYNLRVKGNYTTTVNGDMVTNVEGRYAEEVKGVNARHSSTMLKDSGPAIIRDGDMIRDTSSNHAIDASTFKQTGNTTLIEVSTHTIKCAPSALESLLGLPGGVATVDAPMIYRNAPDTKNIDGSTTPGFISDKTSFTSGAYIEMASRVVDIYGDSMNIRRTNIGGDYSEATYGTPGQIIDQTHTYHLDAPYAMYEVNKQPDGDQWGREGGATPNHTGWFRVTCDTFLAWARGRATIAGDEEADLASGGDFTAAAGDNGIGSGEGGGAVYVHGTNVYLNASTGQVYAGDNKLDDDK